MSTLAQDVDGDLLLTAGRLKVIDGAAAGAAKLFNKFRLFTGEWFRDRRQGVPYFPRVFGVKNPNLNIIRQMFSSIILNTKGVKSLNALSVSFDHGTRVANCTFQATWDDGAVITAKSLDEPFLVDIPVQNRGA